MVKRCTHNPVAPMSFRNIACLPKCPLVLILSWPGPGPMFGPGPGPGLVPVTSPLDSSGTTFASS